LEEIQQERYANGLIFPLKDSILLRIMASFDKKPKNISELIDQIDRIREDLLVIQTSMEKMESGEHSRSAGEMPKKRKVGVDRP
jgi:hypothetical protein